MLARLVQFLVGAVLGGGGVGLLWLQRSELQSLSLFPPQSQSWLAVAALFLIAAGIVFLAYAVAPRPRRNAERAAAAARNAEALSAADEYYSERNRAADRDWRSGDLPPVPALSPTPSDPFSDPFFDQHRARKRDPDPAPEPVRQPAAKPVASSIPPPAPPPTPFPSTATLARIPPSADPPPLPVAAPIVAPVVTPPATPVITPPAAPVITRPVASVIITPPVAPASAPVAAPIAEPVVAPPVAAPPIVFSTPEPVAAPPVAAAPIVLSIPEPVITPPALELAIEPAAAPAPAAPAPDPFAAIRDAIAGGRIEEADRLLTAAREKATGVALAELTGLAGDHASAAGRESNAKWLWRLALKRFGETGAMESAAAQAVAERLRLSDN